MLAAGGRCFFEIEPNRLASPRAPPCRSIPEVFLLLGEKSFSIGPAPDPLCAELIYSVFITRAYPYRGRIQRAIGLRRGSELINSGPNRFLGDEWYLFARYLEIQ